MCGQPPRLSRCCSQGSRCRPCEAKHSSWCCNDEPALTKVCMLSVVLPVTASVYWQWHPCWCARLTSSETTALVVRHHQVFE